MTTEPSATSADLADYVRVIRRHWLLILAITVIGGGLGLAYSKLQTPQYDSVARVQIPEATGQVSRDQSISDLQTEVQVMKSDEVAAVAGAKLRNGRTTGELLDRLQVKTPTEARVLVITYSARTPLKARDGAKAFADAYVSFKTTKATQDIKIQVGGFQKQLDVVNAQINALQARSANDKPNSPEARDATNQIARLNAQAGQVQQQMAQASAQTIDGGRVLTPAKLPTSTAGPGLLTNIAIGLLGGLVLGLILTFTRDRFDEQVREAADLDDVLGVPNLGSIPILPDRQRRRENSLVTLHAQEGPHADAFRRLRSAVLLTLRAHEAKIVAVTSANAGDGKSTVSANLAVSLAQAGNRVCLMSADVRRPTLDQFFQVPDHTGLMDVLDGTVALADALVPVAGLSLLTSGRPHPAPTDLLQSAAMEKTMAALRARFDYTVVDTPPVLAVSDVLGMAPILDVVVIVVSASESTEADITAADSELRRVGANLVGAIMNRSATSTKRYKAYYQRLPRAEAKPARRRRNPDKAARRTLVPSGWRRQGP